VATNLGVENWFLHFVNTTSKVDMLNSALAPLIDSLASSGQCIDTRAIAQSIIIQRNTLPDKQFTKLAQIEDILAGVPETENASFDEALTSAPWATHPVLLMPLRLETRFKDGKLLIRIYPDQIFIDTHEDGVTREEYESVKTYKSTTGDKARDAWRVLSMQFGPARAAWLVEWAKDYDFEVAPLNFRKASWSEAPRMRALPDRFIVFAYREGGLTRPPIMTKNPVRKDRTIITAPLTGDFGVDKGLFDEKSKWVVDFNKAVDDGFAVAIDLESEEINNKLGFDRIVVVGVRWMNASKGVKEVEGLLRSHRFGGGLEFISPGTPTNNSDNSHSAYSTHEDHNTEYETAVEGPKNWETQSVHEQRTNGHRLAKALGINAETFRYIGRAGDTGDSFAEEMNTIVWPATGDYYFRQLLSGVLDDDQLAVAREHHQKFVRGGGPYPSIRVGRQPYGILPVTRIHSNSNNGWQPWSGDAMANYLFDRRFHPIVTELYDQWLIYSRDQLRVPRVVPNDDNTDEVLTRILAMEPHSITYRVRPFLGENFIASLLATLKEWSFDEDSPYGEGEDTSPLYWMMKWAETWDVAQERIIDFLVKCSLAPADTFQQKQLLKMLAWFEGEDSPIGMSRDPDNLDQDPADDLAKLWLDELTETKTLLTHIAKESLEITSNNEEVKDAVCRLSSIDYVNSITSTEHLAEKAEHDLLIHPNKQQTLLKRNIADRILDKRRQSGAFSSLQEVVRSWELPITHEDIARRAYEIFLDRRDVEGSAKEDWLRAEEELRSATKWAPIWKRVKSKQNDIARRAYELFLERGGIGNSSEEDWYNAWHQLRSEISYAGSRVPHELIARRAYELFLNRIRRQSCEDWLRAERELNASSRWVARIPMHDEIARKAHKIFEARNKSHGKDHNDWHQAQQELTENSRLWAGIPTHDEIAHRAYEQFLARNSSHGRDREDWIRAERQLNADSGWTKLTSTHDEIARYAHNLFQARGSIHGKDQEDWRDAEQALASRWVDPETVENIVDAFDSDQDKPDIDRLFRESIDLTSHRVDAWVTSFATKRLMGMRERESSREGILIGAYGFVEDLDGDLVKLAKAICILHQRIMQQRPLFYIMHISPIILGRFRNILKARMIMPFESILPLDVFDMHSE